MLVAVPYSALPFARRCQLCWLLVSHSSAKRRNGMLIEAVHQFVFVWTCIVSEGPGSLDHDFVVISAEESHGLFNELLSRHRFFSLAAIHQVRPSPQAGACAARRKTHEGSPCADIARGRPERGQQERPGRRRPD